MGFKAITNLAYHSKSNKHSLLSIPQPSTPASPTSGTRIIDLIFACTEKHDKNEPLVIDALTALRCLMNVNQGMLFLLKQSRAKNIKVTKK
jgi:hypothetical protein